MFYELTASGEAEVRPSGKKSDIFVAARKYIKAIDALSELERALANFPGEQKPPLRGQQVYAPTSNAKTKSQAIVPYFSSVPVSKINAAKRQEMGVDWFNFAAAVSWMFHSVPGRLYLKFLCLAGKCLLYGPLVIGVVYLIYGLVAMWYLLLHPELLARGIVSFLRASPTFMFQGFDAVGRSFWDEVSSVWLR